VDKAFGAIEVSCRKAGHQSTDVRVDSEVQGWAFGNILIGGLIGFAVDAASGAMHEYPQFITLTLVPQAFDTPEERDRYLNERLERFDAEAKQATALLDKDCRASDCTDQRKALEDLRAQRVALLRQRVDRARIRSSSEPAPR